jgi:hypothetical protein
MRRWGSRRSRWCEALNANMWVSPRRDIDTEPEHGRCPLPREDDFMVRKIASEATRRALVNQYEHGAPEPSRTR